MSGHGRRPGRPPQTGRRWQDGGRRRPREAFRTPTDPGYLRDLFGRAASSYDPVNDVVSLGQVRRWRRQTVAYAAPGPADRVLDAFCGPGGLGELVLPFIGPAGELVLADLSPVMLHQARQRVSALARPHRALRPTVSYVVGDLLQADLGLGTFDVVLLGWGLRYVPDPGEALRRLGRLLEPGGRLALLEFTRPDSSTWSLPARLYFRRILPWLAGTLAGDRELYDYLRASSDGFVDTDGLAALVNDAGLRVGATETYLEGAVTTLVAIRA